MKNIREAAIGQSPPRRITGMGGFLRSWLTAFSGWAKANSGLRAIQRLSVAAMATTMAKSGPITFAMGIILLSISCWYQDASAAEGNFAASINYSCAPSNSRIDTTGGHYRFNSDVCTYSLNDSSFANYPKYGDVYQGTIGHSVIRSGHSLGGCNDGVCSSQQNEPWASAPPSDGDKFFVCVYDVSSSWRYPHATLNAFRDYFQHGGTPPNNRYGCVDFTWGSAQPDLTPRNVTLSSTSVAAGGTLTATWTMANLGSGSAGASTTGLRINQSPSTTSSNDASLGSVSTLAISGNGSRTQNKTITIPSGTPAGTYYIWVIADNVSNSTLNQSNVNNDYAHSAAFTVTALVAKSDLVIRNMTVSPSSGLAGSSATVRFTIYNQGSGTANSNTTNIRLSTSASNVTTNDSLLASLSIPNIAAGGSYNVSRTVTIPSGRSAGANYVWAILDTGSTANQSNESNDKAKKAFTVAAPAAASTTTSSPDYGVWNESSGCLTSNDPSYNSKLAHLAQNIFRLSAVPTDGTGCITLPYLANGYSHYLPGMENHAGVDFRAPSGTPAYALYSGNVVNETLDIQNGHSTLVIESTVGSQTLRVFYLHCQSHNNQTGSQLVTGSHVSAGDLVCQAGSVGAAAAHLHLEVKITGMDGDNLSALAGSHCNSSFTATDNSSQTGCNLGDIRARTVDPIILIDPTNPPATARNTPSLAQKIAQKTSCNLDDWNLKYGIYKKLYATPMQVEMDVLLSNIKNVDTKNRQVDGILKTISIFRLMRNELGIKAAQDIISPALQNSGLVMGRYGANIVPTILGGIDAIFQGVTTGSITSYLITTTLTNANNLFALVQMNKLQEQYDSIQTTKMALESYFHSCGTQQTMINNLSDPAAAANALSGINKTFRSLSSATVANAGPTTPLQSGLLAAPSLSLPSNGKTGVSTSPTFSWSHIPGATNYWLMVATNPADLPTDTTVSSCPDCVISGSTDATSYTPPNLFANKGKVQKLSPNTSYYWQVMAFNGTTAGNFSTQSNFTTATLSRDVAAPPAPTNITVSPVGWSNDSLFYIDWTNPTDISGISKVWWKLGSPPTSSTDGISFSLPILKPFPVTALVEGTSTIYVWLEDGSGNIDQNNRGTAVLHYDKTAPSIAITSPSSTGAYSTGNPTVILAGNISDNSSGISSITWKNDRGDSGNIVVRPKWVTPAINLPGSVNVITITALDNAGNISSATITITRSDSDNDGMPDSWELQQFGNLTVADSTSDTDGDGLLDKDEYAYKTDPNSSDTDSDGISDGTEVRYGTNPLLIMDTLDSHRPTAPNLPSVTAPVALRDKVFDAAGFSDPDNTQGDYLAASEWQVGSNKNFTEASIALKKKVIRKAGASATASEQRRLKMPPGLLVKGTTYWIRTRQQDSHGLWSTWSTPVSFTTEAIDPNDTNNDGIDDNYHISGFVDADRDGNDDATQGLHDLRDPETSRPIGLKPTAGMMRNMSAMRKTDIPSDVRPSRQMPYGLYEFRIDGLTSTQAKPATVDVSVFFPDPLPAGTVWYKYDSAAGTVTDFSANATISGRQVTLHLTDGGAGDADGVINGVIIDPGGPGTPPSGGSGGGSSGGGAASSSGGGGGGGCAIIRGAAFDPALPLLFIFALFYLVKRRGKR